MPQVHLHPIAVRFGMADPAGIVYFPRYFDWFHQAMESWFDEGLGRPYAEVLRSHGLPTVDTRCAYRAPCRPGEVVTVELRVARLGRTSLRLAYTVRGADGGLRALARTDVVFVGLVPGTPEHLRPVPLPPDLRDAMLRYLDPDAAVPDGG
jgi:4-hydroxybenzoyl-CoA thioesterase